jgi:molybdopterin biosynthesis enzyme
LVRTAILRHQNANKYQLKRGTAVLGSDAKAAKDRDTFVPAVLISDGDGRLTAESHKTQGSSDLVGFAKADALVFIKAGQGFTRGETVEIRYL